MGLYSVIRKITRSFGYDILTVNRADELCFAGRIPYLTEEQKRIIEFCRPFTQTTKESLFALVRSVEYLAGNKIPGSFVECGVWRGGSIMAMAMALDACRDQRELFLFDTFLGMPASDPVDVDLDGNNETWYRKHSHRHMGFGQDKDWNASPIAEVKKNIASLKDTRQKFHYIEGLVEETIPATVPETIALLRLDTDFYASTRHELMHLFPRITKGGVLIIDDYGHFLGARRAVDEYFKEHQIKILMRRIDYTGIIGLRY